MTDALITQLLDERADATPDAHALGDGTTRLSWSEYREGSARIAAALLAAGVRPGDRVGVHLPKSAMSFVAVHGVLRAGAIVVPIDWFAPADYVVRLLTDAAASAIVSTASGRRLDELAAAGVGAVVDPGGDLPEPAATVRRAPDDPAYIIYTSGSTGRPKGIVHTHSSALAYARLAVETYGITADDTLANIAPLHFDQSTFELYAAPLGGAAVLVVPDALLRFPASLSELVADARVTIWYSVPYAITQLVTRGAIDDRDLGALRWVLYGGEVFPPAALSAAMAALPSARFSNVYGPAEVNQCTFHHLQAAPGDETVPIGRPWDGVEAIVIDENGDTVTDHETGELWVSGPTMMLGYWGRPDLTEAAIVSRPGDDRRWYRTGDIVRYQADGELVFVGRADHQVKIRGHRIELEAVEAALADHTDVDTCAAIVERGDLDLGTDDRLIVVVAPPPDAATTTELTRMARERLPRYAVPAEIVGLDTLPRTGTGKVDRRALADVLGHGN